MPQPEASPAAPSTAPGISGREVAKLVLRGLATVFVLPCLVSFRVRSGLLGRDRALQGSTQWLSLLPGLPGQYLRRAFLCRTLASCHPSACIEFGTLFSKADARIDANVYIGPRCQIGLAHLGRDVLLAAGVHVPSGARQHGTADLTLPIQQQEGSNQLVHIGDGAWIGSNAVIMADVGRDTIVGAGAVVVKPLPDGVVAGGVPARVLRSRDGSVVPGEGA
jgi:virginiamycin A acetyltransferase